MRCPNFITPTATLLQTKRTCGRRKLRQSMCVGGRRRLWGMGCLQTCGGTPRSPALCQFGPKKIAFLRKSNQTLHTRCLLQILQQAPSRVHMPPNCTHYVRETPRRRLFNFEKIHLSIGTQPLWLISRTPIWAGKSPSTQGAKYGQS